MKDASLSLVVTCGERAVCHVVDSSLPAGELARELALYFSPLALAASAPAPPCTLAVSGAELVWRSEGGPRRLDPGAPIGAQVPPEAEIDLPSIAI